MAKVSHRAAVQVVNRREDMVVLHCAACGYRVQLERNRKPVVLSRGSKTAHHPWDMTPEAQAILGH